MPDVQASTETMLNTHEQQVEWLRSCWKFAAIAQFLRTFQSALGLDDFETEDLEDALCSQRPIFFLSNIFVRLLRSMTDNRFITADNWTEYLQRLFRERYDPQLVHVGIDMVNTDEELKCAFLEFSDFWTLPISDKVFGMHALCEMLMLYAEKFLPSIRDEDSEQNLWRVDPVGCDSQNNTYWLFDDNRLYMETHLHEDRPKPASKNTSTPGTRRSRGGRRPPPRERNSEPEQEEQQGQQWILMCRTLEDWCQFPERFANSKNANEKQFYSFLTTAMVPEIVSVLEEKKKQREIELEIANRKRSNRLVMREIERMELEEQERKRNAEMERLAKERRDVLKERRDQQGQKKEDNERERRLKERELRIKKREELILKQDLLDAKLESKMLAKAEMNNRKTSARSQDEHWDFDCPCGVRGQDVDDGKPMMECEHCNTWVHIPCINRRFAKNRVQVPDWNVVPYMCEYCACDQERPRYSNDSDKEYSPQSKRVKSVNDDREEFDRKLLLPKIKLVVSPRADRPVESLASDDRDSSQESQASQKLKTPKTTSSFKPHLVSHPPAGLIFNYPTVPLPAGGSTYGAAAVKPSNPLMTSHSAPITAAIIPRIPSIVPTMATSATLATPANNRNMSAPFTIAPLGGSYQNGNFAMLPIVNGANINEMQLQLLQRQQQFAHSQHLMALSTHPSAIISPNTILTSPQNGPPFRPFISQNLYSAQQQQHQDLTTNANNQQPIPGFNGNIAQPSVSSSQPASADPTVERNLLSTAADKHEPKLH